MLVAIPMKYWNKKQSELCGGDLNYLNELFCGLSFCVGSGGCKILPDCLSCKLVLRLQPCQHPLGSWHCGDEKGGSSFLRDHAGNQPVFSPSHLLEQHLRGKPTKFHFTLIFSQGDSPLGDLVLRFVLHSFSKAMKRLIVLSHGDVGFGELETSWGGARS